MTDDELNDDVLRVPQDPTKAVANIGGKKMRVALCGSCDGSHDDLRVRQYVKPQGPFTHYYMCPTTDDPVSLSMTMLDGGNGNTAIEMDVDIMRQVLEALVAKRYMIAVWTVTTEPATNQPEGEERRVDTTLSLLNPTWKDFPLGDPAVNFSKAVELLEMFLVRRFGRPLKDLHNTKLPEADVMPMNPIATMFGGVLPGTDN